jgi:hypothetical protein
MGGLFNAALSLVPGGNVVRAAFSFLTSKVGLVLVASIAAFIAGHRVASNASAERNLKAQIERLEKDLAISKMAEGLAKSQSEALDRAVASNKEKVDALLADLHKRAPARAACALNERDARRLRNIR